MNINIKKILIDYKNTVIFIISIILTIFTLNNLEYFNSDISECQHDKSKRDCDFLVQQILKYKQTEGISVKDTLMVELKNPKYVPQIDEMHNQWGDRYENDYKLGIVISKGPDRKHDYENRSAKVNKDDITVPYVGPLTLIDAQLEVNPKAGNVNEPKDDLKCFDILHLFFNKEVALPGTTSGIDFLPKLDLMKAAINFSSSTTSDKEASNGYVFRYYTGASPSAKPIIALAQLGTALPNNYVTYNTISEAGDLISSNNINGFVCWGLDSKEIIIKFAKKMTSANSTNDLFIPGTHYINITGAKNNKNPLFCEAGGSRQIDGAEAAGSQVLIKDYKNIR